MAVSDVDKKAIGARFEQFIRPFQIIAGTTNRRGSEQPGLTIFTGIGPLTQEANVFAGNQALYSVFTINQWQSFKAALKHNLLSGFCTDICRRGRQMVEGGHKFGDWPVIKITLPRDVPAGQHTGEHTAAFSSFDQYPVDVMAAGKQSGLTHRCCNRQTQGIFNHCAVAAFNPTDQSHLFFNALTPVDNAESAF